MNSSKFHIAISWACAILLATGLSYAAATGISTGQTRTATAIASPNAGNTSTEGTSLAHAPADHTHQCTAAAASQVGCVTTVNQTWAGGKTTTGTSGGAGFTGIGGPSDGAGISGTGTATGNGVQGTGGSGGGIGGNFTGGGAVGTGVSGTGVGPGTGVVGSGGTSGTGGSFTGGGAGGGNNFGVSGVGAGSGAGVTGTGGATGIGGTFTAGGGNTQGLTGTGSGSGAGVSGTGGTTSGTGVAGTGGTSNGTGVFGQGTGTGTGGTFTGGASGTGVAGSGGSSTGYACSCSQTNTVRSQLRTVPVTNDPSSLQDGDWWVMGSGATNKAKVRLNGTTYNLAPLDASDIISGTLPEARGGTNQSTYSTGDLLYASGANTLAKRAVGATSTLLVVAGGLPTWGDAAVTAPINVTAHSIGCTDASSSVGGCLTNGTQSIAGNKTLTGTLTVSTALAGGLTQETWTAPTLLNSWVDFGGTLITTAYMKDSMGFVHLRGTIKSGTTTAGTTFFTLPVGYRPSAQHQFPVVSNDVFGEIQILNTGNVQVTASISNVSVSFNGITFDTR